MTDIIYWAAMAGFLTGLLLGIMAGGWVTYRAMVDTYKRHDYDRGAFIDSDEGLDLYDPQPRNDRGGRKG